MIRNEEKLLTLEISDLEYQCIICALQDRQDWESQQLTHHVKIYLRGITLDTIDYLESEYRRQVGEI